MSGARQATPVLSMESILKREACFELVRSAYESAVRESGLVVPEEVAAETPLVGPDSVLDSMALVSVILDLEQRIEEAGGPHLTILSEDALSQRRSPFRTLGTLTDHVVEGAGWGRGSA